MRGLNELLQGILALLSALGLLGLGWLLLGRLLTPGLGDGPVYTVTPASGTGDGLEHTVKGLLWLRKNGLLQGTIVIADGGLDPAGKAVAAALLADATGVVLCPAGQLGAYLTQEH